MKFGSRRCSYSAQEPLNRSSQLGLYSRGSDPAHPQPALGPRTGTPQHRELNPCLAAALRAPGSFPGPGSRAPCWVHAGPVGSGDTGLGHGRTSAGGREGERKPWAGPVRATASAQALALPGRRPWRPQRSWAEASREPLVADLGEAAILRLFSLSHPLPLTACWVLAWPG